MRRRGYFILLVLVLTIAFVVSDTAFPTEVEINALQFIYNNYNGLTTNFDSLNETQVSNMTNVTLERTSYGKIEFEEGLDAFVLRGSDWIVNFNQDVNITDNLIVVDNYEMPGINKQAVISIYGLSYIDPVIYHNGILCSDCVRLSYSGGILKFRTPSFTGPYYARENPATEYCGDGTCNNGETCDTCSSDCGTCDTSDTGGGGGGGETTTNETDVYAGIYDFKIFPELVEIQAKKGTYIQKKVRVENNGSSPINIGVYVTEVTDFIFPEIKSFTLQPGEVREIRFDVYVSEKRAADVYLGKIIFYNLYRQREADVVLQVLEREALFDIRTTVLKKYINPGGRVRANISLINMGDLRNFDINLVYKAVDFDKNEYTIKEEQFAINQSYNNIFFLDLPEDIPIGNYVFYSQVYYKDINASSYDTFVVEKISYIAWILLILIILVLMYLVYRWYKERKAKLYSGFKKKEESKKTTVLTKEGKTKKEDVKIEEGEVPILP
ncbi:hypothetical protein GW931_00090 [archaeon]|nr:hypothetical protein [archaeon]